MRRATSLLAAALVLFAVVPAGAQALPRGFFGIVPQTAIGKRDTARMRGGGVETIRAMVSWAAIQQSPRHEYDWGGLDDTVALAAEEHLEVLPFLISTPHWLSHDWRRLPVDGARQRRAWGEFVSAAVERYGRRGEFWAEHGPGSKRPLPRLPIRAWQIWNEENYFYATMVRHGDRRGGLYLTELGWGSQNDPGVVSFEVGLHGQARELRDAYSYLIGNRHRLGLRQVDWFTWKDLPGSCTFCDSAGLFRRGAHFRPKPAWRTFVSFARRN